MTSLGGDDADVLQVMLLSLSQDKLRELAAFCDHLPNLTLHVIAVRERKDFAQLSQLGSQPFGARFLWYIDHQYLGSNYLRAHDRYNYRFHDFPRDFTPAVIHFAGRIAKPFHLRLTAEQEGQIRDHLAATGDRALRINPFQTIKAEDMVYYRQWWEVCAQTPVFDRIAPIAAEYTDYVLKGPRLPLF